MMKVDQFKLEYMYGKWDRVEEEYKPFLVNSLSRMKKGFEELKGLTEG